MQQQPLVYRWNVVVAVVLVVVGPTRLTTTNSTAITKLRR
jgi:Sec-independent protein translocase protein TatA